MNNIALKVLSGPLAGQLVTVDRPLTIGRQGDIVLEDPKVSGLHAQIGKSSSGFWVLTDNESKNGIRVNEMRVKAVTLKPGIVFQVGESNFEVLSMDPPVKEAGPQGRAAPKKKQRYWYEILSRFLTQHKKTFKDETLPLAPLEPALILEFVRGLQMNSKWILGYGPRKLGPMSIDLPILEPGAPEVCFEIHPSADGILFKTDHADVVLVNQEKVDRTVLHVGDTISILDTMIEVDFSE